MGEDAFGINRSTIVRMTDEIAEVAALGVELAIVIGGGNIFRGVARARRAWTARPPTTWA